MGVMKRTSSKALKVATTKKLSAKCIEHMAGVKMTGMHSNYDYCALHDKYMAKAKKAHAEGLRHAHRAEMWRGRWKKKQCFKSQWKTKDFIGDSKWGSLAKRISLVWSKNYVKQYRMRWPKCYNIHCFRVPTPRNVVEKTCDHDPQCSGFSFTADKRLGTGCLKRCFNDDSFNGYGAISNDYWKKREIEHIQIWASLRGVMLYTGCYHNGEQTMSWKGPSRLVTNPYTFSKSLDNISGIHRKQIAAMSVPKGWCIRIYSKKNYKGQTMKIVGPRNIDCLGEFRMHEKTSWLKQTQSLRIYKNSHCWGKKREKAWRKKQEELRRSKMVNYRQVPQEYANWWDRREEDTKRATHKHMQKYKQSHYWKKNQIAKVIKGLERLHVHSLHCEMGEPGCLELTAPKLPKLSQPPKLQK